MAQSVSPPGPAHQHIHSHQLSQDKGTYRTMAQFISPPGPAHQHIHSHQWSHHKGTYRTMAQFVRQHAQVHSHYPWDNTTHLWHSLSLSVWPDLPMAQPVTASMIKLHSLSWDSSTHIWHSLSLSVWQDILMAQLVTVCIKRHTCGTVCQCQ